MSLFIFFTFSSTISLRFSIELAEHDFNPLSVCHQCCGTGTGTVGTVTFSRVEPEPEP
jgi:hypothetical protein